MKSILDYIFDWLPFGFGVPIFIGVGFSLLADEFKSFNAARLFFYLATAWIYGKVLMWGYFNPNQFYVRAMVVFLVCGVVGVCLTEALRLTSRRETEIKLSHPQERLPTLPNLELLAVAGDAQYPAGTEIAGIRWSSRFVDLRVTILNPSTSDYADVDLMLRPDEPVAEIAQVTNVPDVSFLAATDLTMRQELQIGATGERIVNPLVLVLTTGGYRVRCESFPRKGRLEIILAIARANPFPKERKGPPRPDGGIFERNYVLKIDAANGISHWFGHGPDSAGRVEEAFEKGRYVPKTVRVEGSYRIGNEQRMTSQLLDVKDLMGDAIREIRKRHP